MRARLIRLIAPLLGLVPTVAIAQTSDPAWAQGHLQQAFALKAQARCSEAIPFFLESIRLNRQPEALFHLADCEEKLGLFGAASTHYIEARDLAHAWGLERESAVAQQRLLSIDRQLATAPTGWIAPSQPIDDSPGRGQRIAGFGFVGVGVVSVVIGAIFGTKVVSKNDEIDAICPTGQPCPSQSVVEYHSAVAEAKIDRAVSLLSFGMGAVFVGTGAVLVLTAPKRQNPGIAVWVVPAASGAALGGTW
jgi:hypothetical protein